MRKVVFAIMLGLVCQGCFSREAPEAAAAVSPVNPEVEAAGLIRTLDISTHLQDSARAHAARQIARGLRCPAPTRRHRNTLVGREHRQGGCVQQRGARRKCAGTDQR